MINLIEVKTKQGVVYINPQYITFIKPDVDGYTEIDIVSSSSKSIVYSTEKFDEIFNKLLMYNKKTNRGHSYHVFC